MSLMVLIINFMYEKNFVRGGISIKILSRNGTEVYDEKISAVKNYKVFKKSLILMTKLRNSCRLHHFGEPRENMQNKKLDKFNDTTEIPLCLRSLF